MKDGLYLVQNDYLTAGFVIRGGHVVECAPILRKRLEYWKTIATFVEEGPTKKERK